MREQSCCHVKRPDDDSMPSSAETHTSFTVDSGAEEKDI